MGHVGPHGADDAVDVDAVVLVEPLVLDRDDRLLDLRVDLVGRNDDSRLRAAQDGENGAPVVRIDIGVLRERLLMVRVQVGHLSRDGCQHAEGERRESEQRQHEEQRQQAELANAAPLRRTVPFPEQRQSAR